MLHAVAPFYSVLMRVDPENPSDTTHLVCDLCTAIPKPTDDEKTYTFKIRTGVKFHDGSPLTAADVATSWQKIIFPPKGVLSVRQNWWSVVDSVESPDPATVVFRLKFATASFLPSLADPLAFIFPKAVLDKDIRWFEQHVLGSGPFRFVGLDIGQAIKGERNPDYYHKGKPYLENFVGIFADKQVVRVEAIHSGRGDGVPRPAASRDQRPEAGPRRQDQGADPRLELRQPDHAQRAA
jgi:peptide/nickel transport system substrate-binding protein